MLNKTTKDANATESIVEKLRFWQIVLSFIAGIIMAFMPTLVKYTNNKIFGPIHCKGHITITYPANKTVVYGDEIDVAGVVDPKEGCKNVFLLVGSLDGHNYFSTDAVTVNPDGTWDATAKLQFIPYGTRARIQARLCGEHNAYPPEGCLPEIPNKGIASNSVVVSRQAGLPEIKPKMAKRSLADGKLNTRSAKLHFLEFSSVFASGYVSGIDKTKADQYKIVIYYQDNKFGWVKQPYPGNGRGYGWAAVLKTGEWSITLRNRPSDKMNFVGNKAILLMNKQDRSPDRVKNLDDLKVLDKIVREVKND
jgi:hypothetical protein